MIITNFCKRGKVSNVMTCANFSVDISRDIDSDGGTKLGGFPSTSWLGLTTAALTCCCDVIMFSLFCVLPFHGK